MEQPTFARALASVLASALSFALAAPQLLVIGGAGLVLGGLFTVLAVRTR